MHRILLAVVALATCALFLFSLGKLERRIDRSETTLREIMADSKISFVILTSGGTSRAFLRAIGEDPQGWAERVERIMAGREEFQSYLCTTLTGCDGPSTIQVCTPCPVGSEPGVCQANHDAEVQAFCTVFHCDGC